MPQEVTSLYDWLSNVFEGPLSLGLRIYIHIYIYIHIHNYMHTCMHACM